MRKTGLWNMEAEKDSEENPEGGSGLCGEGSPAAKSWWPGDGRGPKCHPSQQPPARWHLGCPEGISYRVGGDSRRSWDLGQVCTCTSIWDPPGFWCFSFLVKLGKARITAQLGSPLPRSHEHNYVHHFLWIKQQRRTPGALEELGWEAGMLGLHWIPGPWVEFRGSINLDLKIILLCFHCCPAETEHFLHLWMFQPAPGVITESRTLSPREITGSLKPQDS